MIAAEGLTKVFGGREQEFLAVDALDLEVDEGEVFGFLGPNGAGKTTTVRMLATLVGASSGRAWVNGIQIGAGRDAEIRARIGILTESPGLYERLSAEHNLRIFAELYGCADPAGQVEKYLRLLGLWERRDDPAGTFSKGMKQKLAIARALVHEPAVVFLDEPTSGLDPEASKNVCDFVETLRGQGRTIFLCTHNLDEAERLCDRVGVFQQRLIAVDSPDALRRQLFGRQTVVQLAPDSPVLDPQRLAELLPGIEPATVVAGDEQNGVQLIFTVRQPHAENPEIVRALVGCGARIEAVTEVHHSLEDVYLSLIRDGAAQEGVR
ncbi:ABC-2 type transport system ATP-binding protein [Propionicimonas paludicola]|uniref:ABC-2 type transport system ATP-binding protein n=1 Tax=Propionicimonas paludicola TaxID=185243 RepID=A0A2A9CS70_9ACTN|nr:ABC transporter ATP-binding protein [Propionicimonas paludicola]PFG16462.1 ABC-2 type transport system ATP-binding protein [Propionicimonas paludicola]